MNAAEILVRNVQRRRRQWRMSIRILAHPSFPAVSSVCAGGDSPAGAFSPDASGQPRRLDFHHGISPAGGLAAPNGSAVWVLPFGIRSLEHAGLDRAGHVGVGIVQRAARRAVRGEGRQWLFDVKIAIPFFRAEIVPSIKNRIISPSISSVFHLHKA